MATSKRGKLLSLTAAALALVTALSACGSTSGTHETAEAAPVKDGGNLVFGVRSDPINFNPSAFGNGNTTWNITRQLYDSLVYQDPKTEKIEPWLAEEFSSNADATEFTFKLRDDVTFSDGTKLTAETVKANLDDVKKAGASSVGAAYVKTYESTQVVDEHTAVVKFSAPNAAFLSEAATPTMGLISDKSTQVPYEERANGKKVSGSGPFVLKSYTKDQSTIVTKRDGYKWAPKGFDNTGDAHLDSIEFKVITESANLTGGLVSGQLDVIESVSPNDYDTVAASANVVQRSNPGTVFGVYFNEKKPLFQDELIRDAISHAVNPAEVVKGAWNDRTKVADSPISHTTLGYESQKDKLADYDPKAAEADLDKAGWTKGADGIREKDGQKLKLRIAYKNNSAVNSDSIAIIQEQLKAVGIDSEQFSGTIPEFIAVIGPGKFDLAWSNLSNVDGDVLRSQFSDEGTNNWPIQDQGIEQELKDQLKIGDASKRNAALAKIQSDIIEGRHFVPVHELTSAFGVSKNVTGIKQGADARLDLLIDAAKQ